jgi:hypothetical protein
METNAGNIRLIYEESGFQNLRIVQQTMWDFERLHQAIEDKYRQRKDGMRLLLLLFFALSLELKMGKIDPIALRNRPSQLVRMMREQSKQQQDVLPFEVAQRKYSGIDLAEPALSDQVLIDLLSKGLVNPSEISKALSSSHYFVDPSSEPAWRVVWQRDIHDDKVALSAIAAMEQQFENREFVEIGEILHVFGLRLSLVDDELLSKSRAEVIEECKSYVDDLHRAKRLQPLVRETSLGFFTGYAGLGFAQEESEDFKELFQYIQEKSVRAQHDSYPDQAAALLREMEQDDNLFWRRINYTNTKDSVYASIPIFVYMDGDAFVEAFLRQRHQAQRSILLAIQSRYEHERLDGDLNIERPWVEAIANRLQAVADDLPPIGKARLRKFLRWTLQKVLTAERQGEEQKS